MEPTIIRELEPRPQSGHCRDLPPKKEAGDNPFAPGAKPKPAPKDDPFGVDDPFKNN